MMYKTLRSLAVMGLCLGLASATATAENLPVVKIGQQYYPSMNVLAQSAGFFDEEFKKLGTTVEFTYMESGAGMNTALASGDIDIGAAGATPVIVAIAQGIPVTAIMAGDVVNSAEGIVAREGINSVKDLAGKKVGVPFVSTAHFALLASLDYFGVDRSTVQIIDLRPADAVAAFARGDVDAMAIWDPQKAKAIAEFGGKDIFNWGDLRKATNGKTAIWDVFYARTKFVADYPELIEAYVRAVDRAIEMYQSDPDKAAAVMMPALGAKSVDEVKEQMAGLDYLTAKQQMKENALKGGMAESLYPMGEFFFKQGHIEKAPTQDEIMSGMYDDAIRVVAGDQ